MELPRCRRHCREALLAIEGLKPTWPVESPKAVANAGGKPIETAHFTLEIDGKTGAISRLRNKATGREWAGPKSPIALFTYQTLSREDFQNFMGSYLTTKADWALKDFGKPNIERFGAKNQDWQAESADVQVEETGDAERVLVRAAFKGRSGFPVWPRRFFHAKYSSNCYCQSLSRSFI